MMKRSCSLKVVSKLIEKGNSTCPQSFLPFSVENARFGRRCPRTTPESLDPCGFRRPAFYLPDFLKGIETTTLASSFPGLSFYLPDFLKGIETSG